MSEKRRLIDFGALTAAAAAAPASSFLIYGAGGLAMMATRGGQFDPTVVPNAVFLGLFVTLWGFAPAFLFGGAAMAGLAAWRPAWAGRWQARLLAGFGAASAYSAFSLVLAQVWPTGALFVAPWAVAMSEQIHVDNARAETIAVLPVVACILAAGVVGGWVYHRLTRRG